MRRLWEPRLTPTGAHAAAAGGAAEDEDDVRAAVPLDAASRRERVAATARADAAEHPAAPDEVWRTMASLEFERLFDLPEGDRDEALMWAALDARQEWRLTPEERAGLSHALAGPGGAEALRLRA